MFSINEKCEVYSKSNKRWVKGFVTELNDSIVRVLYEVPSGKYFRKSLYKFSSDIKKIQVNHKPFFENGKIQYKREINLPSENINHTETPEIFEDAVDSTSIEPVEDVKQVEVVKKSDVARVVPASTRRIVEIVRKRMARKRRAESPEIILGKDKEWKDMTCKEKRAVKTLGYTSELWSDPDHDIDPEETFMIHWDKLSQSQHSAALFLGYRRDDWDEMRDEWDEDYKFSIEMKNITAGLEPIEPYRRGQYCKKWLENEMMSDGAIEERNELMLQWCNSKHHKHSSEYITLEPELEKDTDSNTESDTDSNTESNTGSDSEENLFDSSYEDDGDEVKANKYSNISHLYYGTEKDKDDFWSLDTSGYEGWNKPDNKLD